MPRVNVAAAGGGGSSPSLLDCEVAAPVQVGSVATNARCDGVPEVDDKHRNQGDASGGGAAGCRCGHARGRWTPFLAFLPRARGAELRCDLRDDPLQ